MTDAAVHRRERRVDRVIRTAKTGRAREAIGDLEKGAELFLLTFGQFSLIDALASLLRQTGPADVVLSTWTAGNTDLTTTARLLENVAIRSLRMVVDRSFLTRQPGYCRKMIQLFGPECIRTLRGHAKFAAIVNEEWTLAVRTSMNLNTNPRLENLEISDDPGLCGFLVQVVDDVFREQAEGEMRGELPELASLELVEKKRIETGRASAAPRPGSGRRLG